MKVKVDADLCIGSASCEEICPNVFKVLGGTSEVQADPVPAEEEGNVADAVEACPMDAIEVSNE